LKTLARRGYRFIAPITGRRTPPLDTVAAERNVPAAATLFYGPAVDLLDDDVAAATVSAGDLARQSLAEDDVTPVEARAKPFHLAILPLRMLVDLCPGFVVSRFGVADAITLAWQAPAEWDCGLRRLYSNNTYAADPASSPRSVFKYLLLARSRRRPTLSCHVQLVGADGIELWHRTTMNHRASCSNAGSE